MGGLRPRIDGAYGASRAPAALPYRGDGWTVGDPYQLGKAWGSPAQHSTILICSTSTSNLGVSARPFCVQEPLRFAFDRHETMPPRCAGNAATGSKVDASGSNSMGDVFQWFRPGDGTWGQRAQKAHEKVEGWLNVSGIPTGVGQDELKAHFQKFYSTVRQVSRCFARARPKYCSAMWQSGTRPSVRCMASPSRGVSADPVEALAGRTGADHRRA